jgi:hypothetical protein
MAVLSLLFVASFFSVSPVCSARHSFEGLSNNMWTHPKDDEPQ